MRNVRYLPAVCLFARFCLAIPAGAEAVTLAGRVELIHPATARKPSQSANAVVWLTPAAGVRNISIMPGERRHFRLIQQRKRFEPHILVVPVTSVVEFPNFDPFFHNVFSLFEGKRFDLG